MSINLIDKSLLLNLIGEGRASARLRATYNFHKSYEERAQRLLNAIGVDSYIRPHRHLLDPKNECLIAVMGLFALILFDDSGNVLNISKFGTEKYLDIRAVHSILRDSDGSIFFYLNFSNFLSS